MVRIFSNKKVIFLDYASATPVLKEVKDEMDKYWSEEFYNPSAIYEDAKRAKGVVEDYRKSIARLLSVASKDIIFTSGGTESDNLAILGAFEAAFEKLDKPHLIISSIEHPAVTEAAEEVKRRGGEVSIVPVNEEGLVNPEDIRKLLTHNTYLVSVMYANNETGVVEPIGKIARIIREYRKKNESKYPYFHTDASQAPSYLSLNLEGLNVDMATLDAGKIYGPRGIGCLVVRPSVRLRPRILGGGQERGLRSGTENTALIAGFYRALEIAAEDREEEVERLSELKKYFLEKAKESFHNLVINSGSPSLPNIISISFPGTMAEMLLLKLERDGILVSTGSSCSSNGQENGSPVIKALGKPELAESTLRISMGRFTKKKDVDALINSLLKAVGESGPPPN